jgi:hypothetical protein
MSPASDLTAMAARLVVEQGLEYVAAKRKALKMLGLRAELPSNEAVEDEVRAYLALFHAETQPGELAALRVLARTWLERLAEFRPHLTGSVWRGTATRLSPIRIELYADDPKAPEIALLNGGVAYSSIDAGSGARGEPHSILAVIERRSPWAQPVTVFLSILDRDDLRGALRPDARGRPWRGDMRALERLMDAAAT